MAPSEVTEDYYGTLEVPHTATLDEIKRNYRRLARTLHPDKNTNKPDATLSVQRLSAAYETVSDPERRRKYDWQRRSKIIQRSAQKQADKGQSESRETEWERAAKEAQRRQKEQQASQERLRPLEEQKSRYERDIFEANRAIRRLSADLKRLQEQNDVEAQLEKEKRSWWTYFTSLTDSSINETMKQKQQRENDRLQRRATKRIREHEILQMNDSLRRLENQSQDLQSRIAAEKRNCEGARKRAEEEQERKKWAKFQAERNRLWREEAERKPKANAQEAREAKEGQERVRRAREAAEAAEAAAAAAASARETRERESWSRPTFGRVDKSICGHEAFWPQLEGRQLCENCNQVQSRFAFQCPKCIMVACASCRRNLKR